MRLLRFLPLVAAALGVLSLPIPALAARGGIARAGIARGGVLVGARAQAIDRFGRRGCRNRFNRFGDGVFVGGGGYPYAYPSYPMDNTYPNPYQNPYPPYYPYSYPPYNPGAYPPGNPTPSNYTPGNQPELTITYRPSTFERQVYLCGGVVARSVQIMLKSGGYYRGPVDGVLGVGTRTAIRSYQADRGLPVTGEINAALIRSINWQFM